MKEKERNEFSYRFLQGLIATLSLFVAVGFFHPPSPTFKTWISILTR